MFGFFYTVNRAAGGLGVSKRGHPRPFGQSGTFDNPVVGLLMGGGVQLQANHPLVETSVSDPNCIHLPCTIRVKIWAGSLSSFFCC